MAVSTTFGYHAGEDRLWISCGAWPQRVWLTRRMARILLQLTVGLLEAPASGDARPAAERAAAEHDASLNRPQAGEHGHPLQMGREPPDAPALSSAVLCTRCEIRPVGLQIELCFHTVSGQRRLQLSRVGLHRWLHALHIVLQGSGWADWPAAPDWLTRSYLPPALQKLLQAPLPASDLGADEDDAPPAGR